MILVHAFCSKDYRLSVQFFQWCAELGKSEASVLLVAAKASVPGERMEVISAARAGFKDVRLITPAVVNEHGWPTSCNTLWAAARGFIRQQRKDSWLWTEPDCVPLKSDWLERIASEYAAKRKPFMGAISNTPFRHMTGVAVYPPAPEKFNPSLDQMGKAPWDCVNPTKTLANMAETGLIQHVPFSDPARKIVPTFPDADSLSLIKPEAVLFHRCKDGSLIERMRNGKPVGAKLELKSIIRQVGSAISGVMQQCLAKWHEGVLAAPEDMPAFVQLGRIGDILNILPLVRLSHTIFHHLPVPVVIHQSMKGVLGRIGYAKPYLWKGAMEDREGAADYATQIARKVLVPQLFGPRGADPAEWKTKHFNLDHWDRCGLLNLWGQLPLEVDRRDWATERKWSAGIRKTAKPLLCYNLTAVSAPFAGAAKLAKLLADSFGDCELIDLGKVRGEAAYADLLGLMDQSHALLTIDTATIHLAQASHCPYIALVSDHVNGWLGSELRRAPALSVLYGDVDSRTGDIIDTLRRLLGRTFKEGKVLHCVSRRELKDDRLSRASASWDKAYSERLAIPVHVWSMRRNAQHILGDKRNLPFLRDVLEAGLSQAADDDVLMLTNDDVAFTPETIRQIHTKLRFCDMLTASRIDVRGKVAPWPGTDNQWQGKRHCGRDLLAWRAGWLRKNFVAIPDFVLGASEWDITLAAIARRQFGVPSILENLSMMFPECELSPGLLFHEQHQAIWNTPEIYNKAPSQVHNQTLCEEWLRANEPGMKLNWFKRL